MEDNENIDEHLKANLRAFLVQPKISSYDEVLKKMQKEKRRRFFFFLFPGLLIFCGALSFFFFVSPISSSSHLSEEKTKEHNSAFEVSSSKKVTTPIESNVLAEKKKDLPPSSTNIQAPSNTAQKIKTPNEIKTNSDFNSPAYSGETSIEKENLVTEVNKFKKESSSVKKVQSKTKQDTLNQETREKLVPDSTMAEKLEPSTLPLLYVRQIVDLRLDSLKEIQVAKNSKDSLKKEKKVKFFAGAFFNPQVGSFLYTKNKRGAFAKDPVSDVYLKTRKEQNDFSYNYAYGIKMGILIKNKWEILGGFSIQSYSQKEDVFLALPASNSLGLSSGFQYNTNEAVDKRRNIYRYLDISLETAKVFTFNRFFKVKAGIGLHEQKLTSAAELHYLYFTSVNRYDSKYEFSPRKWVSNVSIKVGLIEDLTKRIQFQVCPNLFCAANSMFQKDYMIRQRNFGIGLECLLLFRLR